MPDKLYLTIARGPNAARARTLIVSDNEELVREVSEILTDRLSLDRERVAARLKIERSYAEAAQDREEVGDDG